MHLDYIKDNEGKTVAVQIPYQDFVKLKPLIDLVDAEYNESRALNDNERNEALQSFLSLHNKTLESQLPDLRSYLNEDRSESE